MGKKVCIYAICKNESKFVLRWYNSIKTADYIRVLDTGSTDNTLELLEQLKQENPNQFSWSQKEIKPWRFDVARNESMKLIPEDTDICVSADLDDVFPDNWKDFIIEDIEKGYNKIIGGYQYYDENDNPLNVIGLDRVSLYGQAYWENALHERLICENEKAINDTRFLVEHRQDLTKDRRPLYFETAKNACNQSDPYSLLCYGYECWNFERVNDSIDAFETLYSILPKNSKYLTRKWVLLLAKEYEMLGEDNKAWFTRLRAAEIYNEFSPFEDDFNYNGELESDISLRYYYDFKDYPNAYYYGAKACLLDPNSQLYRDNYGYYVREMNERCQTEDDKILEFIYKNVGFKMSILDVGPFFGKWADYLSKDFPNIDAAEVFEPYIDQYHLRDKYRTVYVSDILNFDFDYYDVIILGDVLEHIDQKDAVQLIEKLKHKCKYMLFVIPYMYLQDEYDENVYQTHKQPDLSLDKIREVYPDLILLGTTKLVGYYYCKGFGKEK